MKILLSIFLLLSGIHCYSQLSPNEIEFLRSEISKKVNELRNSVGVQTLEQNDTLKAAAELHSNYMALKKILSHDESKSTTATPKKRVIKCKGKDFELVGENILQSKPQEFPLNKKSIQVLADDMFLSWKNSPGHYANMIDPEYTFADLGFKVDPKKGIVYVTHVFGKKGVIVPGQFSENAYGITNDETECNDEFGRFQNIVANLGNSFDIVNDSVKMFNHDLYYFNKIFTGPNDGLAVDVIDRSQFKCNKPNQLDFSPVYDGVLLQPVYTNELIKGNQSESNYHLITTVGVIPENFYNSDYSVSVILIKNGKKCKYLVPTYVPAKNYELRLYEPELIKPVNIVLTGKGIIHTQELDFKFDRNHTEPIKLPEIKKIDSEVFSVQIKSYSSVEGNEESNRQLHVNRAKFIENYISKKLKYSNYSINVDAKENWDKMTFQFNYCKADSLAILSHDSIKNLIASGDKSLNWDSLFFEQRISKAYINYYGEIPVGATISDTLKSNLRYALATKNIQLANLSLYGIYMETNDLPLYLFENDIFDQLLQNQELVQNAAACFSKICAYNLYKTTEYLHQWIQTPEILNTATKNNLINLYTLTGYSLLDKWDVSTERLSHVLHPLKISKFDNDKTNTALKLNEQLTFIQYYGQINDREGTRRSFDFIADYFRKENSSLDDIIDLSLFFNQWSMYKMTTDLLVEKFNQNKLNEDALFILAHTLTLFPTGHEDVILTVHEKVAEFNNERWCKWIYQEFQILRNHEIKRIYCNRCNEFN